MAHADAANDNSLEARDQKLQELLAASVLRDRHAFAHLYELTSAKLYGVILRIFNREEWAQDCLQEAYIKVWNRAESYRPDLAAPLTWMSTIARNQALDQLRRRRQEVPESAVEGFAKQVDQDPLPLERLQQSDAGRRLNRCLEQLRSQQRQVITLAYFRGLSHDELSYHWVRVKTWIRRGLEQLKRCLEA